MLSDKQIKRKQWLIDALEAISNAQLGIFKTGASSMQFNGRSITNISLHDLDCYRRMFTKELEALELKEQGLRKSSTVRVIG